MLFWALVQGLEISVQVSTEKQSSAEWGKGTGQSLMDSFQEGHVRKSLLWAMKGWGRSGGRDKLQELLIEGLVNYAMPA